MKVMAVVGPKKSGKTLLISSLIGYLKKRGRVGTIKHMPHHPIEDKGDTSRHFQAGASVVIGLGQNEIQFKVSREGSLDSALEELKNDGVNFAIVEGFKASTLPKIVLGEIEVSNCIRKVDVLEMDDQMLEDLTKLVMKLPEYK
jgi:molybdopterin synthase catalytic subunit